MFSSFKFLNKVTPEVESETENCSSVHTNPIVISVCILDIDAFSPIRLQIPEMEDYTFFFSFVCSPLPKSPKFLAYIS